MNCGLSLSLEPTMRSSVCILHLSEFTLFIHTMEVTESASQISFENS